MRHTLNNFSRCARSKFLPIFLRNLDAISDCTRNQRQPVRRECARTRGHLFPRNPLHPSDYRERRERRVLSLSYPSGASPLLISSASCSTALVPAKDPTLQYVFIQGIRRQKRTSGIGREPAAECQASAEYTRGRHIRERTCTQKEKGGVHGTRSVIFAEVATPASV